jgi:hypothetical protein
MIAAGPPFVWRRGPVGGVADLASELCPGDLEASRPVGVGDLRSAVGSQTGHERGGQTGRFPGTIGHDLEPGGAGAGDGGDGAVGEAAAIGEVGVGVEEDPVGSLVGAGPGPSWSFASWSCDCSLFGEVGSDPVGEGFAVGVGDG